MSYIKIYNKDLMPTGVISTDSIEVVENGERYAKIKNAEGLILGAINIDSEISQSEIQRLVTVYNEKMIPIGIIDVTDIVSGGDDMTITSISDADNSQASQAAAKIGDAIPDGYNSVGMIIYGTNMLGTWTYTDNGDTPQTMGGVVNDNGTQVLFSPEAQDYVDISTTGSFLFNGDVVLGTK